jgi:hypothetical protein
MLNHFDNHNIAEYRSLMLPVAWICGCGRLPEAASATASANGPVDAASGVRQLA